MRTGILVTTSGGVRFTSLISSATEPLFSNSKVCCQSSSRPTVPKSNVFGSERWDCARNPGTHSRVIKAVANQVRRDISHLKTGRVEANPSAIDPIPLNRFLLFRALVRKRNEEQLGVSLACG